MLNCRFVTLKSWPGEKTRGRKRSPFGIKYAQLLNYLERELRHLSARDIVIQAFLDSDDIRNDGWPRSNARFREPGIILSFRAREGEEIAFPCDTYKDWESNLRAICLTLSALRAIDRYGVTKRSEQYTGWKRLGAPNQEQVRDERWALEHLAHLAGVEPGTIRGNASALDLAYRTAARRTHPDTGGNTDAFQLLQSAIAILRGRAA